jgi:RHS repeat-associated protein
VTSYTYTDRGLQLQETKANGNTVDYTYFLDGLVKSTTEKKSGGALVSSHTYGYDPNGNKSQDVTRKMNADNHSAYLDSTTDYTYNPADRLKQAVKTGNGAGTERYVHDNNANVINQTVQDITTAFKYDRNRLLTATTSGASANHNYDPFGREESVTTSGQVVQRNTYDGFDHVIKSEKADGAGALKATTYAFDPLDRTTSETTAGKTTDYEYLGLSQQVLDEKVAGALTKSYQYSPWGERLSQIKYNGDGTTEDGYYGYNGHSDVETLTDGNGDTKATYGYTAYGSDDTSEFTGIDKPDAADPTKEAYNPYRFNAKRWDAQSGTYDMGFRDYDPGLNRFTTRDMYSGALADMNLGADPFTGNRYAFAGGNPATNIELDGHSWCDWCSDAVDWVSDNSDTLSNIGGDLLETTVGVAGMFGGADMMLGGAAMCIAGGIETLGGRVWRAARWPYPVSRPRPPGPRWLSKARPTWARTSAICDAPTAVRRAVAAAVAVVPASTRRTLVRRTRTSSGRPTITTAGSTSSTGTASVARSTIRRKRAPLSARVRRCSSGFSRL